ncbi:MAG TPA: NADPH-dependent FMN reductase [Fibrobacteria bacterium]|nr:NADPH-dependent FMN reductase [Fibrobacteria bacterium]
MKILAVSGSLRAASTNIALLRAMALLAPPEAAFRLAEPLDRLPHFNPDHDGEDPPDAVRAWRDELGAASAVVFCTPEYAHGIPGTFKNALDWDVSSGKLYRKPALVVSASPYGGARAGAALLQVLGAMQVNVVREIEVLVRRETFDAEGRLVDSTIAETLKAGLKTLVDAA